MAKSDDLSGTARLKEAIAGLKGKQVKIGWFETARYAPDEARGRKGGMPVALVAYWLNEGTKYMPARPFVTEAVMANKEDVKNLIQRLTKKVVNGELTADQALGQVGLFVESKIIDNIKSQKYAALSEPYFEWKTKFHANPQILIDTGTLWQTLVSKVGVKE